MTAPEFSRSVKARHLPTAPLVLEPNAEERAALARRFGVVAVDSARAEVSLSPDKFAVRVDGTLTADLVQTCAVSGENFPVRIEEPLALRFVPPSDAPSEEEIELDSSEEDEIEYTGDSFDLGEAVAQSLALAIDPYACGPEAETIRKEAGISGDDAPNGALAELLRGLKKD